MDIVIIYMFLSIVKAIYMFTQSLIVVFIIGAVMVLVGGARLSYHRWVTWLNHGDGEETPVDEDDEETPVDEGDFEAPCVPAVYREEKPLVLSLPTQKTEDYWRDEQIFLNTKDL